MGRILNPNSMMFRADSETHFDNKTKTVEGRSVRHVATQESTRTKKKRTVHIYRIEDTRIIVFNRSRDGIFFLKIAMSQANMKRFYEVFVQPPLTVKEQQWLDLYGYKLD